MEVWLPKIAVLHSCYQRKFWRKDSFIYLFTHSIHTRATKHSLYTRQVWDTTVLFRSLVRSRCYKLYKVACWVQSVSHVWLFSNSWSATHKASLSITNSQSSPNLMSTESVMPFNHLILCLPLLLLPSIFPTSGSFQMTQLFVQVAKISEFQLQYQSFKSTPRTDLL